MKKNAFSGLFLLIILTGNLWAWGMQDDISLRTDYGSFRAVQFRIPADVIIERGDTCRVEADIPSRYKGDIEIHNDRGILVIKASRHRISFFHSDDIRFIIYMPLLNEVSMSSSGRLRSNDNWEADTFRVTVSSSADIELNGVLADTVELRTSSSGSILINEIKCTAAEVRVSSSGDIRAGEIVCTAADLKTSSSGDITANLQTQQLRSIQSGSGDVELRGRADTAEIKTTGSGDFDGEDFLSEEADITITGSGDISLYEGCRLREIRITGSGSFSNY